MMPQAAGLALGHLLVPGCKPKKKGWSRFAKYEEAKHAPTAGLLRIRLSCERCTCIIMTNLILLAACRS